MSLNRWSGGIGRRTGLKIPRPSLGMRVRPSPPAPTHRHPILYNAFILSIGGGRMTRTDLIGSMLCASLSAATLFAQAPAKVDFRRDVQPIFKTNCIGCHGPKLQM